MAQLRLRREEVSEQTRHAARDLCRWLTWWVVGQALMTPSLAVMVLDDVSDPRTLAPITRGTAGYAAVASFLIGVPMSVTAASLAALVTLVRLPLLPTTRRIAGVVPWLVLGVEVVLVMWLADE